MIKLQCVCGNTLALPDALGGQKIRCKRCHKILRVPTGTSGEGPVGGPPTGRGAPSDPAFVVQGSRPCPGCGQLYPPSVVVCVGCGLNVSTGAMLYASLEETPRPDLAAEAGGADAGEADRGWLSRLLARIGLGGRGQGGPDRG